MSFLDSPIGAVSGVLSDADKALGGASPSSASAPNAKPKYYQGEDLGAPPDGVAGSASPKPPGNSNDSMAVDKGLPIQFIHFGFVHLDHTSDFDHKATVQDDKPGQLPLNPPTPQSRAIMFRAALERETILLYGFISACQNVLKEKEGAEGNKGAADALGNAISKPGLGSVKGAASDLLGSTGGSSAPKASDLNSISSAVTAAGGKIVVSPAMYKVVHQTGVDLAQARANYRAFLDNFQKNPHGQKDSGGGLLGSLPGVSSVASGVASAISSVSGDLGNILTIIQGIVFKAFDIYVATFTNIAEAQELAIEKACHAMSIQAIKSNTCPIFAPWFVKNPDDSSSSSNSNSNDPPLLAMGTDGSQPGLGQQMSDLPGKLKNKAEDAATDQINQFLEVSSDGYWSQPYLNQAFSLDAAADAPKDQPPPPPKSLGTLVVQAFKDALELKSNLGFAEDLVTDIMQADADFLETIYQTLLAWDNSKPIPVEDLYSAGRERLLQRLVGLLLSKLTFLQSVKDFSLPFDKKQGKQGGKALDKATSIGIDELNQKFGQDLDPIIKIAMADLVLELDAARKTAAAQNSMTMEVYLGLLPRMLAVLFRDTFFPVWDILVKEGCPWLDQVLGGPVGAASDAFKSVRQDVHGVHDTLNRVKNVADQGSSVNASLGSGSDLGKYKKAWDDGGIGADSDSGSGPTAASAFPLTGRTASVTGGPSTKGEVESVTLIQDSDCLPKP